MGILQARIREWVACPPPGDLPDPGIELRSPTLQADSLLSEPLNNSKSCWVCVCWCVCVGVCWCVSVSVCVCWCVWYVSSYVGVCFGVCVYVGVYVLCIGVCWCVCMLVCVSVYVLCVVCVCWYKWLEHAVLC